MYKLIQPPYNDYMPSFQIKTAEHEKLAAEVNTYLAKGGKITKLSINARQAATTAFIDQSKKTTKNKRTYRVLNPKKREIALRLINSGEQFADYLCRIHGMTPHFVMNKTLRCRICHCEYLKAYKRRCKKKEQTV